jgi:hypothetical protein
LNVAEENAGSERDGAGAARKDARRLRVRYALLTAALFAPLLWSFLAVRNLYPFPAYTMMMAGGDPSKGTDYFVLRGETVGGETVDLPPAELTDALSWRHWSLVGATVQNKSFQITNPHPANLALAAEAGGVERLPRAARLPELLRAWGECRNLRLPADSPRRLRAVRLDAYRWDGETYGDYGRFVESWRAEL